MSEIITMPNGSQIKPAKYGSTNIATPKTAISQPREPQLWIATEAGTYPSFGNLTVTKPFSKLYTEGHGDWQILPEYEVYAEDYISNLVGTDYSTMINAAITDVNSKGGGTVKLRGTTYTMGTAGYITLKSNVKLIGEPSTLLDFSTRTSYASVSAPLIRAYGSAGSAITVTESTVIGTSTIKCDTTTLTAGALINIYSDAAYDGATPTNIGELHIIKEIVSATELTVWDFMNDAYLTTDNAMVKLITPVENIYLETLNIKGKGRDQLNNTYCDYGLMFEYAKNIHVEKCIFNKVDQCAIDLIHVYGFHVQDNKFYYDTKGANTQSNYGIKYSNASCHGVVKGNLLIGCKHAILNGFRTSRNGGLVRFINISHNTIIGTWHAGIMNHTAAQFQLIHHNIILNCYYGMNPRDIDMNIESNIIIGSYIGIWLTQRPKNTKITKNIIKNTTNDGILLTSDGTNTITTDFNPENIEIVENEFQSIGGYAVEVKLLDEYSIKQMYRIENNDIRTALRGILVEGAIAAKVNNNTLLNIDRSAIRTKGLTNSTIKDNNIDTAGFGTGVDSVISIADTEHIQLSGATSPTGANDYYYNTGSLVNTKPSYKAMSSAGSYFIWWDGIDSWKISNTSGGGTIYFSRTDAAVAGAYDNVGEATGTVEITITDIISDNVKIIDNDIVNINGGAGYFKNDSAITDLVIKNTTGFTTENTGTAQITAAVRFVVITHSISATPSASQISITPLDYMGSSTKWFITEIGATTFKLNVDQVPGSDINFEWRVII